MTSVAPPETTTLPTMKVCSGTSSTSSASSSSVVVRHSLLLYVNGMRVEVPPKEIEPEMTLLHFLRTKLGLTGTKLGCGEGGCGACTVMVSKYDISLKKIRHFSVNSCLTPVCSMDTCAITTVEGVGQIKKNGLHPVQKAIAESNGSQCGYCTPGFVMALYSMIKQNDTKPLSMKEIEHNLDGNLCRCTGYRPILDAAKSFGFDASEAKCKGTCENCPNKENNTAIDIEDLEKKKKKKILALVLLKKSEHSQNNGKKNYQVVVQKKKKKKKKKSFR
jgi:xanthine dehydrogenase/oxidase